MGFVSIGHSSVKSIKKSSPGISNRLVSKKRSVAEGCYCAKTEVSGERQFVSNDHYFHK